MTKKMTKSSTDTQKVKLYKYCTCQFCELMGENMEGIDLEPRWDWKDCIKLWLLVMSMVMILLFIFLSANKAFASDYVCSPTSGYYQDMEFKRKEFNTQSEANRFSFDHTGIVISEAGKYAVIYHDTIPAPETSYVCVVVYE